MNRLDEIVKRLVAMFPDDPSAPSVLLSWIIDKQHFYGSLVRYTEPFGRGKEVIYKCTGVDTDSILLQFESALGADAEASHGS